MRSLAEKITFEPQNPFPPIRFIVVPTGNHEVTGGRVLPGLKVDGNREVIKNRYSIEFVVANNCIADDAHHSHFELATRFTHALQLNLKYSAEVLIRRLAHDTTSSVDSFSSP